jgi:hypothetical protein
MNSIISYFKNATYNVFLSNNHSILTSNDGSNFFTQMSVRVEPASMTISSFSTLGNISIS